MRPDPLPTTGALPKRLCTRSVSKTEVGRIAITPAGECDFGGGVPFPRLEGQNSMFENAELGHKVDKPTYEQEVPQLRAALLEAQRQLADARFSVVVIVAGVTGAGKSETVNLLLEWLNARGIETHA